MTKDAKAGTTTEPVRVCAWCWYARPKRDICGIYCTGGFENQDGSCKYFKDYEEEKRTRRKKKGAVA